MRQTPDDQPQLAWEPVVNDPQNVYEVMAEGRRIRQNSSKDYQSLEDAGHGGNGTLENVLWCHTAYSLSSIGR